MKYSVLAILSLLAFTSIFSSFSYLPQNGTAVSTDSVNSVLDTYQSPVSRFSPDSVIPEKSPSENSKNPLSSIVMESVRDKNQVVLQQGNISSDLPEEQFEDYESENETTADFGISSVFQNGDFTVTSLRAFPLNYTDGSGFESLRVVMGYSSPICGLAVHATLYADVTITTAYGVSSPGQSKVTIDFSGADIYNSTDSSMWSVTFDITLYCSSVRQLSFDVELPGVYSSQDFYSPNIEILSLSTNSVDSDDDNVVDGILYNFTLNTPVLKYNIYSFDMQGGWYRTYYIESNIVPFGPIDGSSVQSYLSVELESGLTRWFDLGLSEFTDWEVSTAEFGMQDIVILPRDTDGNGRFNIIDVEVTSLFIDAGYSFFSVSAYITGTGDLLTWYGGYVDSEGLVTVTAEIPLFRGYNVTLLLSGSSGGIRAQQIVDTIITNNFEYPIGEILDTKIELFNEAYYLSVNFTAEMADFYDFKGSVFTQDGRLLTKLRYATRGYFVSRAGTVMQGRFPLDLEYSYSGNVRVILTARSLPYYFTSILSFPADIVLDEVGNLTVDVNVSDVVVDNRTLAKEITVGLTPTAQSTIIVALLDPTGTYVYRSKERVSNDNPFSTTTALTISRILSVGFIDGYSIDVSEYTEGKLISKSVLPVDLGLTPLDLTVNSSIDVSSELQYNSTSVIIETTIDYNFTFLAEVELTSSAHSLGYSSSISANFSGVGSVQVTSVFPRNILDDQLLLRMQIDTDYPTGLSERTMVRYSRFDVSSLRMPASNVSLTIKLLEHSIDATMSVEYLAYLIYRQGFVIFSEDGSYFDSIGFTTTIGGAPGITQTQSYVFDTDRLYRTQQSSDLYIAAVSCVDNGEDLSNCEVDSVLIPPLSSPVSYISGTEISVSFVDTDRDGLLDWARFGVLVKIGRAGTYQLNLNIMNGFHFLLYGSVEVEVTNSLFGEVIIQASTLPLGNWNSLRALTALVSLVDAQAEEVVDLTQMELPEIDLSGLQSSPIQIIYSDLDRVYRVSEGRWAIDLTIDVTDDIEVGTILGINSYFGVSTLRVSRGSEATYIGALPLGLQTLRVEFSEPDFSYYDIEFDYLFVQDVLVVSPRHGLIARYYPGSAEHFFGSPYLDNSIIGITTIGFPQDLAQGDYANYTVSTPSDPSYERKYISYLVDTVSEDTIGLTYYGISDSSSDTFNRTDRSRIPSSSGNGFYTDFALDPLALEAGMWVNIGWSIMFVKERVSISVGEHSYSAWVLEGRDFVAMYDSVTGVLLYIFALNGRVVEITHSNIPSLGLPEFPFLNTTTISPTTTTTTSIPETSSESTSESIPLFFSIFTLAVIVFGVISRLKPRIR